MEPHPTRVKGVSDNKRIAWEKTANKDHLVRDTGPYLRVERQTTVMLITERTDGAPRYDHLMFPGRIPRERATQLFSFHRPPFPTTPFRPLSANTSCLKRGEKSSCQIMSFLDSRSIPNRHKHDGIHQNDPHFPPLSRHAS